MTLIETLQERTIAKVKRRNGFILLLDAAGDTILMTKEESLFDHDGNHFLTWDVEDDTPAPIVLKRR